MGKLPTSTGAGFVGFNHGLDGLDGFFVAFEATDKFPSVACESHKVGGERDVLLLKLLFLDHYKLDVAPSQ